MGISASSELGRAILRQRPELLASSTKAERAAKREALTCYGYTFRSKAELAYARMLDGTKPRDMWRFEPFTLHLPGGVSFTPDFSVRVGRSEGIRQTITDLIEVKPAVRLPRERDSIVRLKSAAAAFPEFAFFLARISRGGEWTIERVSP